MIDYTEEQGFDFEKEVNKLYPDKAKKVYKTTLKKVYNESDIKTRGVSTEETRQKGVYALYENGELKKIGKASDKNGVFHRVSSYYRGKKDGTKWIKKKNREDIEIQYFHLEKVEECWYAERKLQTLAYEKGEEMPWEDKTRN